MVDSSKNYMSELMDDNNFEQKKPFNYDLCVELFEECGKNVDNMNIYLLVRPIWEITKAFEALSSALSVGFSDITSKVQVWRSNVKTYYPQATTIQEIIEKEIELQIMNSMERIIKIKDIKRKLLTMSILQALELF